MSGYEFPWDMTRALEVALYRTCCVPSISAVLDRTGEFYKRTQKRYDDTALLVAEISKWGYDSERGREAVRRVNRAHSRFDICNSDYLYVLSTFIYEPIRWIDRFGWRGLTGNERLASYYFWCAVGRRVGIREIPESYEIAKLGPPNMDDQSHFPRATNGSQ
ncbi:MAG: oxygenase MpaB family protein [Terrimicrobiaceae bacterium]